MKYLTAAIAVFLLASCLTVDVEEKTGSRRGVFTQTETEIITVPVDTEPVPPEIVERPVFIPYERQNTPPYIPRGSDAAREALKGVLRPEDYSHAAVVYGYEEDRVYEVYCQPMRATDVRLQNSETMAETPFLSDSERWKIGAGVSYENGEAVQHVYVKPDESGLEASLIINTDRRVYHLLLRSYKDAHMPKVRWKYPGNPLPWNVAGAGGAKSGAAGGPGGSAPEGEFQADPRFLSFNYQITYPLFGKPRWTPALAYDDGKKTYITFPEEALRAELPAVFENRADTVNYRVTGNVIIIDKLIEAVTVKIGKRQVIIRKKKG